MIGRISGTLLEVFEQSALIDVHGLGYEVELTSGALVGLSGVGAHCALYTHHVAREDGQSLFGFGSREERDLFRTLIKVNGVGPKLALAVLSHLSLNDLVAAVQRNETGPLTKVPGVGKRMAERLMIELKDKLDHLSVVTPLAGGGAPSGHAAAMEEALLALQSLGYKSGEAERVLATVPKGIDSAEEIIRVALTNLGGHQSAAS